MTHRFARIRRFRFNLPQRIAAALLAVFLAQGLWLTGHQTLTDRDYQYARCGREMWERPSRLDGSFTSCGNIPDGVLAYRLAGLPLTLNLLAERGLDNGLGHDGGRKYGNDGDCDDEHGADGSLGSAGTAAYERRRLVVDAHRRHRQPLRIQDRHGDAAQPLDVGEQVASRVGGKVNTRIAGIGPTSAPTSLVKQDDPVQPRIEVPVASGAYTLTSTAGGFGIAAQLEQHDAEVGGQFGKGRSEFERLLVGGSGWL